jgi:type III secretory pathway lipoprotein EscJ
MMRSVPELRAANATLQAQVEEERRLRRAAEEELARLSKAMKGITSALQGLQELEN